ncbi:MAG: VPLPA-CTERM sorting domain-containing protein [Pseudomonadota bacterium]
MKLQAFAALAAVLASPVYAATLTYNFSAEYQFGTADDDSVSTIADTAEALIGTTLTGSFTLDDTFLAGDAVRRTYAPGTISIDQMDLSGVLPFTDTVLQNSQFNFDGYTLRTILPDTTGEVVSQIFFTLRDLDENIIGDTGFPPLPALSEFELTQMGFIGNVTGENGARERVNYTLTSLELAPIPLPAGSMLLLTGLGALALARRRSN